MSKINESRSENGVRLPSQLPASYENRAAGSNLIKMGSNLTTEVIMTTGTSIIVDPIEGLDFNTPFTDQESANKMWLYSLQPLRIIGEAIRAGETTLLGTYLAGWESAANHLESRDGQLKTVMVASADHAAATRLRACLEAGELVPEGQLCRDVRQIADRTIEWLLAEENYRPNNHGLMSSISLLHWYIAMQEDPLANQIKETAVNRVVDLARESFDEDGLCNENTIGYHNFNLLCYDEVRRMQAVEKFDETIETQLLPIMNKADLALSRCMLQDNTIPTIGDSGRYPVRYRKSLNESAGFPQSGFGVVKNDDLYVSAICGGRSEIHKHADDSAITLYYDCQPLIVDSGSYLYDPKNPYRQSMESSLGHSLVIPEVLDGLSRRELLRAYPGYWARTDSRPWSGEGWQYMKVFYGVEGLVDASRAVAVTDDSKWVSVVDRVSFSEEAVETQTRQRWLFGPQLGAQRLGQGRWWCPSPAGKGLNLISWGCADEELYRGEVTGKYRGWYSENYGRKEPCYGLDLISRGRYQVIRTIFHVSDKPLTNMADVPSYVLHKVLE